MRPFCFDCRRARSECFCGEVAPFDPGFDLALCVHPREARNAVGTARIIHRFISKSRIFIGAGEEFEHDGDFQSWLREREGRTWILYPSTSAHWLDRDGPMCASTDERPAFVVIDGTWPHAKKMLRTSPSLRALPQVAFTPKQPSRYEIREQPQELCLSSLEAVHSLIDLSATRGHSSDRPHDRMLDTFLKMVASQVAHERRTRARTQEITIPPSPIRE